MAPRLAQENGPAFLPRDTLESQGLLKHVSQQIELSKDNTTMNRASNTDVTFTASFSPVLQLKTFPCHCTPTRKSKQQIKMHTLRHRIEKKYKTITMEIIGSFKS